MRPHAHPGSRTRPPAVRLPTSPAVTAHLPRSTLHEPQRACAALIERSTPVPISQTPSQCAVGFHTVDRDLLVRFGIWYCLLTHMEGGDAPPPSATPPQPTHSQRAQRAAEPAPLAGSISNQGREGVTVIRAHPRAACAAGTSTSKQPPAAGAQPQGGVRRAMRGRLVTHPTGRPSK